MAMKKNRQSRYAGLHVKTAIGLLAALVLSVGALFAAPAWATPATQSEGDMDHLKALSGQEFEKEFISMMIMHHQSAVDMAKLAADRANHQEVKTLALSIISDQTREIGEMTGWLKQWYNAAPMQGMMHGDMDDMMQLERSRGDDFDKMFLTMMRMHHMSALEMAMLVPDRATHAELKTLAQNITTSQTAEIEQMEGWLMAWYNINAAAGGNMPPDHMSGGHAPGMPRTGFGYGTETAWLLPAGLLVIALMFAGGAWMRKRA